MQHSHSNSLSSPNDHFQPSGDNSSFEKNSFLHGFNNLNRSPGMVRTLDCPLRGGTLGINNLQSTGSEQISRSGNVGLDALNKHYNSHGQSFYNSQFHVPHTPNSNHKSSTHTKSASGSQNASSNNKSNRSSFNEPVKVEQIKLGKNLRTYLCVKNIPCRYSKKELKDEISKTHKNMFWGVDIISDKKEPKKQTNMGYFFIDFKHPLFVVDFYEEYQGKTWELHNSDKKIGIYYGRTPKKEFNKDHKLDANLMAELHRIVKKYDIKTPLEAFNRVASQPKNDANLAINML